MEYTNNTYLVDPGYTFLAETLLSSLAKLLPFFAPQNQSCLCLLFIVSYNGNKTHHVFMHVHLINPNLACIPGNNSCAISFHSLQDIFCLCLAKLEHKMQF